MGEILEQSKEKTTAIREGIVSRWRSAYDKIRSVYKEKCGAFSPKMREFRERAVSAWESVRKRSVSAYEKLSPREQVVLIFLVGAVLGFGTKSVAHEQVTIGYQDYTLSNGKSYDLIALQKKVAEESDPSLSSVPTGGGLCQ